MTMTAATHPTVLTDAQVKARFGSFAWRPNGSSAILIDSSWVAANIETVLVPQLTGVPTYGGSFSGRVQWHKKGVEQLLHAWAEVADLGLMHHVIFWGGSFVPRRVRGSTNLSRHSWGTAFDINPEQNWLGEEPADAGEKGYLRPLVPVFERHGFCWGGRWRRKDGMHLELAEERTYTVEQDLPDGKLVIDDNWQKALPIWIEDGVSYADIQDMAAAVGDSPHESQRVSVGQYLSAFGYRVKWDGQQKKIYAYKA